MQYATITAPIASVVTYVAAQTIPSPEFLSEAGNLIIQLVLTVTAIFSLLKNRK